MKKKSIADIFAENIFNDAKFQDKWQEYIKRFGNDLNTLWGENYQTKLRFAAVLQKMSDGNHEDALRDLNGYISLCANNDEINIIQRLINRCESHIIPKTYPQKSARYMRYRDMLLSSGFSEANQQNGRFYRRTTEKAAFAINLTDKADGMDVMYGFASTAYALGDEEWFANNGADNETCQVRNMLSICAEDDERISADIISAFYNQYKSFSKDEILTLKKERQKVFLDHFSRALKPLGFKKKATTWTKDFGNGRALSFEAQKSAYSDQYYFNVNVHSVTDFYAREIYERVVMNDSQIYNWQLMTEEQIKNLIQYALVNYINPKIDK